MTAGLAGFAVTVSRAGRQGITRAVQRSTTFIRSIKRTIKVMFTSVRRVFRKTQIFAIAGSSSTGGTS